jgi:hypothetical protein
MVQISAETPRLTRNFAWFILRRGKDEANSKGSSMSRSKKRLKLKFCISGYDLDFIDGSAPLKVESPSLNYLVPGQGDSALLQRTLQKLRPQSEDFLLPSKSNATVAKLRFFFNLCKY